MDEDIQPSPLQLEMRPLHKKKVCLAGSIAFIVMAVAVGVVIYFTNDYSSTSGSKIDEFTGQVETMRRPEFRLPENLKPTHYMIQLLPNLKTKSIYGYVEITFFVVNSTSKIVLHTKNLSPLINRTKIQLVDANSIQQASIGIKKENYISKYNFYTATTNATLKNGKIYIFSMEYTGSLSSSTDGFYYSEYSDANGKPRGFAATQFEPTFARMAFPCFDEPRFKANFTIKIARENTLKTLSNMPRAKVQPVLGLTDWSLDIFETTVPMSTYLVAFVISDFDYIESNLDTIPFKVWGRNIQLPLLNYAVEMGPKLLTFYEAYFNMTYVLPKMDVAFVPTLLKDGGMESFGLVSLSEIETQIVSSPLIGLIRRAMILSHTMAHQWLGNVVTPASWQDNWLREGFATYVSSIGLKAVNLEHDAIDYVQFFQTSEALRIDSLRSTMPLHVSIRSSSDVQKALQSLIYLKGSAIAKMMSHILSKETFRRALSNYVAQYSFRNAATDDLLQHMSKQARADNVTIPSKSMNELMHSWIFQKGYPVLQVQRKTDGTVILTQNRFLIGEKHSEDKMYHHKWCIPISYTNGNKPRFSHTSPRIWLTPEKRQVVLKNIPINTWVIFNIQRTGFYRVNYDEENWIMIMEQLMENHTAIDTINRAQLLEDVFALAKSGQLRYDLALSLLSYIKYEKELIPWKVALTVIDDLLLMSMNTPIYSPIVAMAKDIFYLIFDELNVEENPTDSAAVKELSYQIIDKACKVGYAPCVEEAQKIFNFSINNSRDGGEQSLLERLFFCYGVKNANRTFIQTQLRYNTTEASYYRMMLLCSDQYYMPESVLGEMVPQITQFNNSDGEIKVLKDFKKFGSPGGEFDPAIENVYVNKARKKKYLEDIMTWSQKNGYN